MPKSERGHRKRARKRRPTRGRRNSERSDASPKGDERIRLNRFIARAGICSRREADELITRGVVTVNESVMRTLGVTVGASDEVFVRGKRIIPSKFEYILLNKPSDIITTASDEKGRKTVMDLVSAERLQDIGLFPVGRLDRHTTGILLITNDGMLAHRLTHPKFEVNKMYRVRSQSPLSEEQLNTLRAGVELEDGPATVDRIEVLPGEDGREVGISIHEGRNRQIRRMFEKIGHQVDKLERVKYAGLTTNGVRRGKWRILTEREVLKLYRTVKL